MTFITFSQPKLKNEWNERIRRIFNIVKTKSAPDLWIKVFIYRNKEMELNGEIKKYKVTSYRGHYRWAEYGGHGFYDPEWDFMRKHPKIKHVITLKLGEECDDEAIASLIAHEFRHYLQYKKYRIKMNPRLNGGSRAVQVERDAKKWALKRMNQLIGQRKIKHKEPRYNKEHWYNLREWEYGQVVDGFVYPNFLINFKEMTIV